MSRSTSQQSTDPRVRTAARATAVAFIGAGFAFSSWAARIPQVKAQLHLSASELGLVLLGIAAGSGIAMPLTGQIIQRIGSRRTTPSMALLLAAGLAVASLGFLSGVAPLVAGLFVFGFANGAWDVSMNV